jgi:hypothetical protein
MCSFFNYTEKEPYQLYLKNNEENREQERREGKGGDDTRENFDVYLERSKGATRGISAGEQCDFTNSKESRLLCGTVEKGRFESRQIYKNTSPIINASHGQWLTLGW